MEHWLLELVHKLGYFGIFIATLVESTFVPIPAEATVIPAGILVAKGELNYWGVLISATLGVIVGSIINYWIGIRFGHALILKYGKYIFIKPAFLHKTEVFFARYGRLAVFLGRLLPGVKHYIAFVAGIAEMRFQPFLTYTAFGGLIWIWILLQLGYMAERNAQKGGAAIHSVELIILAIATIAVVGWLVWKKLMKH